MLIASGLISLITGYTLADRAEDVFWAGWQAVAAVIGLGVLTLIILWKSGILPAWMALVGQVIEALARVFTFRGV